MDNDWREFYRKLDTDEARDLLTEWSWMINGSYKPFAASIFGDLFLEHDSGVFWLNTGTGELKKIADNAEEFIENLNNANNTNEWLLASLAKRLVAHVGQPSKESCYSYNSLPIFKEGGYGISNFKVLPLKEHVGVTGSIHKQLQKVQDGQKVRFRVVD